MTSASAGALTAVPTAAIFPSRRSTLPFRIVGPAAVMIVTSRISVARVGGAVYVLGNGSALGADTAPAPTGARALSVRAAAVGEAGPGCGAVVVCAGAQLTTSAAAASVRVRIAGVCLRKRLECRRPGRMLNAGRRAQRR
jgi:hypothetical protein